MMAEVLRGYFAGKMGEVLHENLFGDGWVVKFPNNKFVFTFRKDNLKFKEEIKDGKED